MSEIFREAPGNWGLRGDPYLWEDLKLYFGKVPLPCSPNAFLDALFGFFEKTTGQMLTKECQAQVCRYAQGGMSSGMVSGAYWLDYAAPLLLERLEKANTCIENEQPVFSYEEQARTAGITMIASSAVLILIGVLLTLFRTPLAPFLFCLFAVFYLPLLAAGIAQLYFHRGAIRVRSECIEYIRRRKTLIVPFREVGKVRFRNIFFPVMKLSTAQGTIWISKDIEGYQRLYRILAERLPQLFDYSDSGVDLRLSLSTFGSGLFGIALFVAGLLFIVNGRLRGTLQLFPSLFIGGLSAFFIVFIVYSMLTRPYVYRFDRDGVTERAVIKSKRHPIESLRAIEYGQIRAKHHTRRKHFRMVNYIGFRFTDGSYLSIDDQFTSFPIELAVSYAENAFGIKPMHRMIESNRSSRVSG
ncbi:MAG: hypothetical protein ACOX7W_07340 [Christensenellales bacterium]